MTRDAANPRTRRAAAQDGINNDALLIDDCNGNPAPHHCAPLPMPACVLASERRTSSTRVDAQGLATATVTTAPTPKTAAST